MTDDGVLETREDGKRVVRFERQLGHPVERVWAALTADEIAQTRQPHGCHDKEETRAAQVRDGLPQAAHSRHLPRVHPLLQSAGDYE